MSELQQFPEIEGMMQTGMTEDELLRIARHPYATQFLRDRLEDIDTLADPELQQSIKEWQNGEVIPIDQILPLD